MTMFRTGAEDAQKSSKRASFARAVYFQMKDGETKIIRLLTEHDSWINVNEHNFVPTKPAYEGYKGDKWPSHSSAICRNTKMQNEQPMFGDCFICEFVGGRPGRAAARTFGLAVEREEVREDGKLLGFRDKTREVKRKVEGKEETKTEKAIVIVDQAWSNFWNILDGFAKEYGTILDRDYKVTRNGDDKDTTYQIVPMERIPWNDPDTGKQTEAYDGYFDVRNPKVAARYEDAPDLADELSRRASEEYYSMFFDTRVAYKPKDDAASTAQAEHAATNTEKPSGDADPARLQALRNRILDSGDGNGAAAAEPSPEPAQAEPTPVPVPTSGPVALD
jgi:hypothetical protein